MDLPVRLPFGNVFLNRDGPETVKKLVSGALVDATLSDLTSASGIPVGVYAYIASTQTLYVSVVAGSGLISGTGVDWTPVVEQLWYCDDLADNTVPNQISGAGGIHIVTNGFGGVTIQPAFPVPGGPVPQWYRTDISAFMYPTQVITGRGLQVITDGSGGVQVQTNFPVPGGPVPQWYRTDISAFMYPTQVVTGRGLQVITDGSGGVQVQTNFWVPVGTINRVCKFVNGGDGNSQVSDSQAIDDGTRISAQPTNGYVAWTVSPANLAASNSRAPRKDKCCRPYSGTAPTTLTFDIPTAILGTSMPANETLYGTLIVCQQLTGTATTGYAGLFLLCGLTNASGQLTNMWVTSSPMEAGGAIKPVVTVSVPDTTHFRISLNESALSGAFRGHWVLDFGWAGP